MSGLTVCGASVSDSVQGPLVVGFHERAGHGSLPLRHRRLVLGFVASFPIERVLDGVSAADAKRVEELGF